MSGAALGLVLLAAGAHALWNFVAKTAPGGGTAFVWLASIFGACVLAPPALVLIATSPPSLAAVWFMAGSGVLHAVYFACLQRGYRDGDLSLVYPLARGTGPLLATVAAVVVLGERPGGLALVGGAVVVAAILWLAAPAVRAGAPGTGWALATGVTIAAYTLWDAHSVTALAVPPVIYFGAATLLQSTLMLPMALRFRPRVARIWHDHKVEAIIIGIASPVAYLLVLFALQRAPVSLVAPAREVSIVFGGLLGWLVLHEPNPARRLAGAVVVLVGIAAIALG